MTARQVLLMLVTAGTVLLAGTAQATPKIKHKPPEITKGKDVAIKAVIQADGEVVQPYVAYRITAAGEFVQIPLKHDAGKDYSGVIPASVNKGNLLEYYIGALDGSDLSEATWKSKAKPERVQFGPVSEEKEEKPATPAEKPAETTKAADAPKPAETAKSTESKSAEKPEPAEGEHEKAKTSDTEKASTTKDEKPAADTAAETPPAKETPPAASPAPATRPDRAATGVEVVRQYQAPSDVPPLPRYQADFRAHAIYDAFLSVGGVYLRTPNFVASGVGGGFDALIGYATDPNFAPSIKGGGVILPKASQYYIMGGVMMPQLSFGVFVGAVNLGPIEAPRQWGAQADIPIVFTIQPLFKLTLDFGGGFVPNQGIAEATVRIGIGI